MEKITIKNPKNTCLEEDFTSDDKTMVTEVASLADVSDGYHTIAELYEHRITLYIALCHCRQDALNIEGNVGDVWRSKLHSDGTSFEGWFILGIGKEQGQQITYHLPLSRWDETNFAKTLDRAPEWDGHTSADVLERLKDL